VAHKQNGERAFHLCIFQRNAAEIEKKKKNISNQTKKRIMKKARSERRVGTSHSERYDTLTKRREQTARRGRKKNLARRRPWWVHGGRHRKNSIEP